MPNTSSPTPSTRPEHGATPDTTHGPDTPPTPFDLGEPLERIAAFARLVDAYLEEHGPALSATLEGLRMAPLVESGLLSELAEAIQRGAEPARQLQACLEEYRPALEEKLVQLQRFAVFVEATRQGTIIPISDLER